MSTESKQIATSSDHSTGEEQPMSNTEAEATEADTNNEKQVKVNNF